jgi:hypothetical protein
MSVLVFVPARNCLLRHKTEQITSASHTPSRNTLNILDFYKQKQMKISKERAILISANGELFSLSPK